MRVTEYIHKITKHLRQKWAHSSFGSKNGPIETELPLSVPAVDEEGEDWHKRGESYIRIFVVDDFPKTIKPAWWSSIIARFPQNLDSSIHIEPITDKEIDDAITLHSSTLYSQKYREEYNSLGTDRTKRKIGDINHTLGETDENSYFYLSINFVIRSNSKEGLEKKTDEIKSIASNENFSIEAVRERHREAMRSCAPLGTNEIEYQMVASAEVVAAVMMPGYNPEA